MSGFALSRVTLDPQALAAGLAAPAAGAMASFEGRVRDHDAGRRVTALEYEAYEPLALREGARIVAEAVDRHGAIAARCVHRVGRLGIGEVAVWIGVVGAHRGEAFAACRWIIDQVKVRVPIWKLQTYADGSSDWVQCSHGAPGDAGAHRKQLPAGYDYSRQLALPQVGPAGQRRLAGSRVVVIGAGGLGCQVLASLAGAGVGVLHVVDGDCVEASNLHRQPLYVWQDLGRPKAEAAAARLAAGNPDICVVPHVTRLAAGNAAQLAALGDVIVDCSDNLATKFLVNDAALRASRPAVVASVYQFEGQLQVARPGTGGSCLRCLWPTPVPDGVVGNCVEAGVLGPVPGVLGQLQAMETLKLLLQLPGQLVDELLIVDLLSLEQRRIRVPRATQCSGGLCSRVAAMVAPGDDGDLELHGPIERAVAAGYLVVDIREPCEVGAGGIPLAGCQSLPFTRLLADGPACLDASRSYLLVCAHGQRSLAAAAWLRNAGLQQVRSLAGGLAGQPAVSRTAPPATP